MDVVALLWQCGRGSTKTSREERDVLFPPPPKKKSFTEYVHIPDFTYVYVHVSTLVVMKVHVVVCLCQSGVSLQ